MIKTLFISLLLCVCSLWVEGVQPKRGITAAAYKGGYGDGALTGIAFEVEDITGDTLLCTGDRVLLCVGVQGTSEYAYEWKNVPAGGDIYANCFDLVTTTAGTYNTYCEVTDKRTGVKVKSKAVLLIISQRPNVSIAQAPEVAGSLVKLTATGANTYLWNTGETTAQIVVAAGKTTTYTVTGTTGTCKESKQIVVSGTGTFRGGAQDGAAMTQIFDGVQLSGDTLLCTGYESFLKVGVTGTGVYKYDWYHNNTLISDNNKSRLDFQPIESGDDGLYYCKVTDVRTNVSLNTDTFYVHVDKTPKVIITPMDEVSGSSIRLTASGADTYQWNTGAATDTLVVSCGRTTIYNVTGIIGRCSADTSITIQGTGTFRGGVQDGVAMTQIFDGVQLSGDTLLCTGYGSFLEVGVTGTGVYKYDWYHNNTLVSGNNKSRLDFQPIESGDDGLYYCKVTDVRTNVSLNTDTLYVHVDKTPLVAIVAADNVAGSSVKLEASGADTYVWNTGVSGNTLIVSCGRTAVYSVMGTIGRCSADTSITVEGTGAFRGGDQDGTITTQIFDGVRLSGDTLLCTGYESFLEVGVSGTSTYQYEWYHNNTLIPDNNKPRIDFSPISEANGGTYYCKVIDMRTHVALNTDTFDVRVNKTPVVRITVTDDVAGSSVKLQASGADSYLWNTGVSGSTLIVSCSRTTVYTVTGTTGNCSVDSSVTVEGTGAFRGGDQDGTALQSLFGIGHIVGDSVICAGDTAQIYVDVYGVGYYKYEWFHNNSAMDNNRGVVSFAPSVVEDGGTYYCKVTDERTKQSGYTDTFTLKVYPYPEIRITTATVGTEMILTASGAETYQWNNGVESPTLTITPTKKTTYWVRGANGGKCYGEAEILIEGTAAYRGGKDDGYDQSCIEPSITDQSRSELAGCTEDSVTLYITAEGSRVQYQWQRMVNYFFENFVPDAKSHVQGIGTRKLKFNPPVPEDEGLYRCLVKNSCGEVASDTFAVSVDGRPMIVTRLNRDWDQCIGSAPAGLVIYAVSAGSKALTYKWYKDKKLLAGSDYTGRSITIPMNSTSAAGWYKVEVSNDCGMVADSTYLPVNVPASVKSCDTVLHVCDGGKAEFKVEAAGGGSITSSLRRVHFTSANPIGYELGEKIGDGLTVTIPKVTFGVDNDTYFAWVVENRCGGDTSHLIRLAVEQLPKVESISGDTLLCAGNTLRLRASASNVNGSAVYEWYKDGLVISGQTSNNFVKNNIKKTDAGKYYCYVTDLYCRSAKPSAIVVLKVNEVGSITDKGIYIETPVINSEGKYCNGTELSLNVILSNPGGTDSIRWYRNYGFFAEEIGRVSGTRTVSLKIDSLTVADGGLYQVGVFNGCGENRVGNFRIQVMEYAHFADSLKDLRLCEGVNQALSVRATGTAPIRYTWTHNGMTIADGYSSTIQLTNVTVDTGGIYCCEIHNWCDIPERVCAQVKVSHPDTFRLSGEGSICLNSAEGATLKLAGSNTHSLYRLYKNGVIIKTIHGKDVVPEKGPIEYTGNGAGVYYVTQEDDNDHCEARMPGTVTIRGDQAPAVYSLSLNESYCEETPGGSLILAGSEDNARIKYTLYNVKGKPVIVAPAVGGTGKAMVWKDIQEGNYQVVAVNSLTGCTSNMSGIVTMEKRPVPVIDEFRFTGDSLYCAGTSPTGVNATLVASSFAKSYILYKDHVRPGSISSTPNWNNLTAGFYSVKAISQYGCQSEESNTLKVSERKVSPVELSGGDSYCPGDTVKHTIVAAGLQSDMEYYVYSESPKKQYAYLQGVSGSVSIEVPSEVKTYYIEARELAGKQCVGSSNKVSITEKDFSISVPPIVTVANGAVTNLTVTVRNAGSETPVYAWTPASLIDGDTNRVTIKTVGMQQDASFIVKVSMGGCVAKGLTEVKVIGNPLTVDIRKTDHETSVDTVRLCADGKVDLYGWYGGGTGSYAVRWYEGNTLINSDALLQSYNKTADGYLRYEVTSGAITEKDSVYVMLYPVPDRDLLADTALQCTYENTYTFVTKPSEAGVVYTLEHDPIGNGGYNAVDGFGFVGDGVEHAMTLARFSGYYRIKALKTNDIGGCLSYSQVVEVRQAPEPYVFSGSDSYCLGTKTQDTLKLLNSQTGVSYKLIRRPDMVVRLGVSGKDGDTLVFTGNYGDGVYVVNATMGKCSVRMTDSAVIERKPVPAEQQISGAGTYCSADTTLPVELELYNAREDEIYTLYRDPMNVLIEQVSGNGHVAFSPVSGAGEYYVEAKGENGCKRVMPDRLWISDPVGDFHIRGNNEYVLGDVVPETTVKLYKAKTGVLYKLYGVGSGYVGDFGNMRRDTVYYTGHLAGGKYVAQGGVGNCAGNSVDTAVIRVHLKKYLVTGDTSYCNVAQGTGVLIGMDTTQLEVTYVLQRKDEKSGEFVNLNPSVTLAGNGFARKFSGLFKDGDYRVVGSWKDNYEIMKEVLSVRAKASPDTNTQILIAGNVCEDSTVTIGFTGQTGVEYQLFHNDTLAGYPDIIGDGTQQGWTISSAESRTYRVQGTLGECTQVFEPLIEVGTIPYVDTLYGDTLLCSNVAGNLYLDNCDAAAMYVLYGTAGLPVDTGSVVNGKFTFAGILPGDYYVVGSIGMCKKLSATYTIKGIPATELPSGFRIEYSECSPADTGWIKIYNASSTQKYVIRHDALEIPIEFTGISSELNLRAPYLGEYCLTATVAGSVCPSDEQCFVLRESVPLDSIVGDFSYCGQNKGVHLRLSGFTTGAVYTLCDKDTVALETLKGATRFTGVYEQGTYVLKKQKENTFPGCIGYDTVHVSLQENLRQDLGLQVLSSGKMCPGEPVVIGLKSSEKDIVYILKHVGTGVAADTVKGTGAAVTFAPVKVRDGYYRVFAEYESGGCGVYVDSSISIQRGPKNITLSSCKECLTAGEIAKGCSIGAKGMAWGVRYVLHDAYGMALDTLYGPNPGQYAAYTAGSYYVIAQDTVTGCRDTMSTHPEIGTLPAPTLYAVVAECDVPPVRVITTGSDGDSVKYTLYRYGIKLAADTLRGNDLALDFGEQQTPGVYKVLAEGLNGCKVWLRDSVLIYNDLDTCKLRKEGDYCAGAGAGLSLHYDCPVNGWKYYLSSVHGNSDTLSGMISLVWKTCGGRKMQIGEYILHAHNGCKFIDVDTFNVVGEAVPAEQHILADSIFCENEGFDIVLGGTETGVTYYLYIVSGSREILLDSVVGTGGPLPMSKEHYISKGYYRIYGRYPHRSCRTVVAEQNFKPGTMPLLKSLLGADVCMTGSVDTIALSVPDRETGVAYYLQYMAADTTVVDSMTSTYKPMPLKQFDVQREIGCYAAYAVNENSGCRRQLENIFCLSEAPAPYQVEIPGDTVRLCQGEDTCVYLANSDIGVKYYLLLNGMRVQGPVVGDGKVHLKIGCVAEGGVYTVEGDNGCSVIMNNEFIVKVNPLPDLTLTKENHYCEGGDGVSLGVDAPTHKGIRYTLYDTKGIELDYMSGNESSFTFAGTCKTAGHYNVVARNMTTNCERADSLTVIIDTLPTPYKVLGSPDNYICWGGSTDIKLPGSESGVRYTLYDAQDKNLKSKIGTGGEVIFESISTPGVYRVLGRYMTGTGCQQYMLNSLKLEQADSLQKFTVKGIRTSYCYDSDIRGEIQLGKSIVGVEYELYKDGVATGFKQKGNGSPLSWDDLEGKTCETCINDKDGYQYHIVAKNEKTGCTAAMRDNVRIIQESDVRITQFHPNKDIYICQDSSVDFTINASGCNLKYDWLQKRDGKIYELNGGPVSDPYYKLEHAKATAYGTYWCNVYNTCGSAKTGEIEVKVRCLMEANPDRDVAICDGTVQNVSLEAVYNGTTYKWYKAGIPDKILGNKQVLVIHDADASKSGQYVCEASNECYTRIDTCKLSMGLPPSYTIIKARTDTICRGGSFEMMIQSPDSVEWYLDGIYTGHVGNTYPLPAVDSTHEGHYSVRVFGCGEKWADLCDLYVDDTIRVLDMTDDSRPLCSGQMLNLFVQTTPTERVQYRWEYLGGETKVIGKTPQVSYGPVEASNIAYTFRIWFTNKCPLTDPTDPGKPANYRQFRVNVNEHGIVQDPDKQIVVCADPGQDTVIRVLHSNVMGMLYSWYFFDYKNDTVRELSLADTLRIPLQTKNSGYYFCRVNNGCEIVATNACWVRIDSVPFIRTALPDDTLCEGADMDLRLQATGGSLNYDWTIRYKDGTEERFYQDMQAEFDSEGKGVISPLTMKHDSALIWCHVYNHCSPQGAYSDTMLLRIHPWRQLVLSADTLVTCENDTGQIVVTLLNGQKPWTYTYITPEGKKVVRKDSLYMSDTLKIRGAGKYRIISLTDATGCNRTNDLPVFKVLNYDAPVPVLSGGGVRCEGDTVSVRLRINKGVGPWEITMVRESDGQPATELSEDNGILKMYGRDTTITFRVNDTESYYIYQTITDLGSGCSGKLLEDRVDVVVNKPDHIDFRTGWPPYIGQCRDVNLRDLLKPTVDGAGVAKGGFYINDKPLNGSNWLQRDLHADCYLITYSYKDQNNCLVTSDEIQICVDSLPHGEITVPEYACEGVTDTMKIRLYPRAQDYTVKFYQHRYQHKPGGMKSSFSTVQVPASLKGVYVEDLSWVMTLPVDSCMRFEIVGITDSHGCAMAAEIPQALRNSVYRDTVHLLRKVELKIETRYPDSAQWIITPFPIDITRGDSVGVRATLVTGSPLWTLTTGLNYWDWIRHISGRDTIFWLRDTGVYDFKAQNDFCEMPGNTAEVEVNWLDTAYIRGRLWLEGPFDPVDSVMKSNISGKLLDLYKRSGWPSIINGQKVIDYIALELRAGADAKSAAKLSGDARIVMRDTCLLLSNGQLADRYTGDTVVDLKNVCSRGGNNYYVTVGHRNHIGVMSAVPLHFSVFRKDAPVLDLTRKENVYSEDKRYEYHMTLYKNDWLLSAGELNENDLISIFDPNRITIDDTGISGTGQYDVLHDVNFDGKVDWPSWNGSKNDADWSRVRRNRNHHTEIKFRK